MQSTFVNKQSICFHTYQVNHLERLSKNWFVAGMVIIESSIEESERKPNYTHPLQDQATLIVAIVTLRKHSPNKCHPDINTTIS